MISWKKKRVLVTGGTGFMGSFMVEHLLAKGAHVRVPIRAENYRSLSHRRSEIEWVEGDLRDTAYCDRLVQDTDHVFHMASCRRNSEYHQEHASGVMTENVRMTLSLIDALRDQQNVPVTFFSTANIPPSNDVIALASQDHINGYVLGKALCELLWYAASRERGFRLLLVRPVGAYGPRDTFSPDANVVPALIVKAQRSKDQLEVWGTGKQERAFLYVEDVVKAVFTLLDAGAEGVQYVTAPGAITVRKLAETIRDLVNPDLPIVYRPEKPIGARSIPRLPLHHSLKSFPWTPLGEGISTTVRWWLRDVPEVRHPGVKQKKTIRVR